MRVEVPITNGFYRSQSLPLSNQKCVNWYPHILEMPSLSSGALFACPGLTQLATAGSTAVDYCRGGHVMDGIPYFVLGSALYCLNKTQNAQGIEEFSLQNLGTITGTGRVSMADNGTQLVVQVPGSTGYVYNGTTLTTITDGDFDANGNPQYVAFIDGYFVWSTDTKKFIISAINDATSIDALDFGSAEADPDDIVAPFVFNNQLIMFGSETHEVFQNIGGNAFPFQRIPGAVFDTGLKAPLSLQRVRGGFMFLGKGEDEGAAIFLSQGGQPKRVSTEPIDNAIQNLSDEDITSCHAWSYGKDGHYFVGFTFPSKTFVYDVSMGLWHERQSRNGDVQGQYRPDYILQAYGRLICGDNLDGRIGELSSDVYDEYGEFIEREASFQPLAAQMENIFLPSIELTIESGVGNDDVTDPKLELRLSRDGRTWSSWQDRSMGKIGEYSKRLVWRRWGRVPRFAVIDIRCSEKCKANILRMDVEIG